jgi:hypothetical protein
MLLWHLVQHHSEEWYYCKGGSTTDAGVVMLHARNITIAKSSIAFVHIKEVHIVTRSTAAAWVAASWR